MEEKRNNEDRFKEIEQVVSELTHHMNQAEAIVKLFNIMSPLIEICRYQEAIITKLQQDMDEVKDRVSAVEDRIGEHRI